MRRNVAAEVEPGPTGWWAGIADGEDPGETRRVDAEPAAHVAENRRYWNDRARQWVAAGERAWAQRTPTWGNWSLPDQDSVTLLPPRLDGLDCIELGCGTGYVSRWMEQRGARRVVGVDVSEAQLATARRLGSAYGSGIEWMHGNAEAVPLPEMSFDLAVSEYGAAIWCDPEVWIPEAHRLLRPGGELRFLGNHPLVMVCSPLDGAVPATERLERSYFGLGRLDWRDAVDEPGGIEFCPTIADWVALFTRVGFEILGYHELRAPDGPPETRHAVTRSWSHRFPSEQIWHLRRR